MTTHTTNISSPPISTSQTTTRNASGAAKTFDAICAVYDERGALITYEDVTATVASGETRKIEFFLSASDWDSYKLFAWDELGSMRPLGWSET